MLDEGLKCIFCGGEYKWIEEEQDDTGHKFCKKCGYCKDCGDCKIHGCGLKAKEKKGSFFGTTFSGGGK